MSLLQNTMAKSGGDFYNGVATQSLRFAYTSAETWLARTPDAGNRKTHTLSVWVKRSGISASQNILEARGSGDAGNTDIWFDANDKLEVSGASTYFRVTTQVFRDTSAWYHLVFRFDTTQGTANNRLLIYVNGSVITEFATNNAYSQNTDYGIGGNVEHRIGDGYGHFDGYMARYEFVDGLSLGPENFGETKNGIWIAKKYGGSYGTNGHKLEFKETGTSANSSGLGADTSGNDNHYTPTAITATDSNMPDCPENNFATWNAVYRIYGDTGFTAPTNGALFTRGGGDVNNDRGWGMSTIAINEVLRNSDGAGVYMEIRSPSVGGDNGYLGLYGRQGFDMKAGSAVVRSDNTTTLLHFHLISPNNRTLLEAGESSSAALAGLNGAPDDGAVIGFAVKSDGKFFISVDGTFSTNADGNTQNPVTGANPFGTIDTDIDFFLHAGNISVFQANFGQDSTFGGNETATTNADANGIGAFHTAPPTGYLALCSSNMAEPTIGPNSLTQSDDYFETSIYEGDGSTQDIAVNFKPDWTWIKNRDAADSHQLFDSNRGVTKVLQSDTTTAEVANDDTLTAFISTGFSLGDDVAVNTNNESYVAWNWKANGGTATATISESGNNPAAVVQANPTAGFSIITYTGTGAAGTIAHGLSSAPKWIITKTRSHTGDWMVYHGENTAAPETDFLKLNETNATEDLNTVYNDTAPTSSVFTLGSNGDVNTDGRTQVAYVFAEVKGYSRMGSYIGNGAAAGPFIYLGFRPAWLLIKSTVHTESWHIWDNKRVLGGGNPNQAILSPNTTGQDTGASTPYDIDFLSNGFKIRGAHDMNNGAADTHIYMAFAEQPFKYSNAR
jgi:hypothetical protein